MGRSSIFGVTIGCIRIKPSLNSAKKANALLSALSLEISGTRRVNSLCLRTGGLIGAVTATVTPYAKLASAGLLRIGRPFLHPRRLCERTQKNGVFRQPYVRALERRGNAPRKTASPRNETACLSSTNSLGNVQRFLWIIS